MVIADRDRDRAAARRVPHARLDDVLVRRGHHEGAQRLLLQHAARATNVLRSYVDNNPYDDYAWSPSRRRGRDGRSPTARLSFGGQPLFPPGIDLEKPPTPGPWFDLFRLRPARTPARKGPGPIRGANRQYLNQTGIVWFPGSAPLYKGGRLVGGVGVSGDGVRSGRLRDGGRPSAVSSRRRSCASIAASSDRRRRRRAAAVLQVPAQSGTAMMTRA